MAANQNSVLKFDQTDNGAVLHYELDVIFSGVPLGTTQIISLDDAADGYDETSGKIEMKFKNINELPSDANGIYSFHVFAVDGLGRSQSPLEFGPFEIAYELVRKGPATQDKRGVLLANVSSPTYDSQYPAGDRP